MRILEHFEAFLASRTQLILYILRISMTTHTHVTHKACTACTCDRIHPSITAPTSKPEHEFHSSTVILPSELKLHDVPFEKMPE